MRRLSKDSLAYALVFVIGYLVACNSNTTKNSTNPSGNSSAASARMLDSTVRNTAIFPTNTADQPVLASIFGFSSPVHRNATISNPSDLGQSFEVICVVANTSGQHAGIHAVFGNSGFVTLTAPTASVGVNMFQDCTTSIGSVGADENGSPSGFPILLSGTINSLVAYGTLLSGNHFRCLDTSNTSSVQDNTFVRPYYDLAHDAVILGSGTTQLALTCSVSIPPGDDVSQIKVQWIKS